MKRTICLMLILLAGLAEVAKGQGLAEPVKPEKADAGSVIIRLDIDTTSFPELAIYNNLRFEIDPHGRKYDQRDADETWDKVEVKKAVDQQGWYVLTFNNSRRRVAYRARPVFEAQDYEQALKTYEAREAEYQGRLKEKRRAQEKVYEQFVLEAAALGAVDNIDERASRYDSLAIATWNKLQQLRLINIDPGSPLKEISADDLNRRFPPTAGKYDLVPIRATYRDSLGRPMELTNVDVVFRNLQMMGYLAGKQIRVAANGDNMIFGVWEKKLYVVPFDDYQRLHIGLGTRAQTFTMHYVDSLYYDLRYFDLRNLIEGYNERHP